MVCTALDTEKNFCTYLKQKFYEGMQKPCDSVPSPDKCPLVAMREG